MEKLFLTTALISLAAGTASAQMAFETGNIDFGYYGYESEPDVSAFILGVRGAYDIGQMGLQFDASGILLTDGVSSFREYSAGVHLYKPLANGSKIGVFGAADNFSGFGPVSYIYSVGAEGMASFGALDIEGAIGYTFTETPGDDFWIASVDAYYNISPAIEINAGVISFISGGTSPTFYSVGISYTLPTAPVSIGATYVTRNGFSAYGLNASFAFGPEPQERLFSSRRYPLYLGG